MKRIIFTLVVLIWWASSLWFLKNDEDKTLNIEEIPIVTIGKLESQVYHSIYYKGNKIGYSSTTKQIVSSGFIFTEISYMRLPIGGIEQEITFESIVVTDSLLRIKNFTNDFSSDEYTSISNGKVIDKVIYVELKTPESTSQKEIPLSKNIYLVSSAPIIAANDSFRQKRYTLSVFNALSLSNQDYTLEIKGEKPSPDNSETYRKAKASYSGYSSSMLINSKGEIVVDEAPGGFISYLEDKDKALKFDLSKKSKNDLLIDYAVKLVKPKGIELRKSTKMKARISGFDPNIFDLNDFNQFYQSDSSIIIVDAQGVFEQPPIEIDDTVATPFIQKNDQRIIKHANLIKGNLTDTLQILNEINFWLFENIKKEYKSSIPGALEVLSKKVGDCNEHSTLFVALARSIGIPCRMNIGLVYNNDMFQYHAWVQAFAKGKWHTFDPTFGQAPADASHIKLLHGSLNKQIEILRIMNPQIEVIDAE
jgi:hypothetical protein